MAKKKKIQIDLSVASIESAIRQLDGYKKELLNKTDQLLYELGKEGIKVIDNSLTTVVGDSDPNHYAFAKVNAFGNHVILTLVVQGQDIAFLEFGAGIHYNGAVGQSPNPKGDKLGYTIGSYGLGQGANDSWVYYDEEQGRFRMSHGTKASMPMYNAEVEILAKLKSVAKRVFGG